jgi:uncharacterized membrane protein
MHMTKAILFIIVGVVGTFVSAKYLPRAAEDDNRFWSNYVVYLLGFYPLFHGTRMLLLPQFPQEQWYHSLVLCVVLLSAFIPAYRFLGKKMKR